MSGISPRILIVGAGPSGLICALSLIQNGVHVRVIDKSPEPHRGQRGSGIMPRTLEAFERLGIVDNVLEIAIPMTPVRRYALPNGTSPLHEFDMVTPAQPQPSIPYPNPVHLGQDRAADIMRTELARRSCYVEFGTELVSITQSDQEVKVQLLKHVDGVNIDETAHYDWIVGADGARSATRKQATFTFDGQTRNTEKMVVGDMYIRGLSAKFWHIWGDASDVLISLRPTDTPLLFSFFIGGNVDFNLLSSDENAVKIFLFDYLGHSDTLVFGDVPWLSLFTPNIRMVQTFQQGRILLVGDAGHVHSPTGGQGMNSGVQDSFNLGWKLALVQRELAPPSILQTYSEERLPVIKEMLKRTTQILNRAYSDKGNEPWTRARIMLQLGVNYRWSSLVLDERADSDNTSGFSDAGVNKETICAYGGYPDASFKAGDRAPDASDMADLLARPPSLGRLFRTFGPSYHTVLLFSPVQQQWASLIHGLGQHPRGTVRSVVIVQRGGIVPAQCQAADFVLEDMEGHAHKGYGVEGSFGVVIVRPDGVVGAVTNGGAGLQKYFRNVFGA